ncbi:MAG: ribonuclease HI [Defluviitaleaceae bacterium]|nr:ribonuclease HI [Defluviitaleaceae bacterium]
MENDNTAKSRKITIYTDGACSGNPGPGGFGVVLIAGNLRKEISEGFQDTTNNRMELKAVITGLSMLKKPSKVNLFTDSRYIVDAVTKKWVYNWKSKGWKRSTGEKALNIDLWEELLPLLEKHEVAFNWVKGHAGNEENERCDELARKGASNPVNIDFKPQ